MPAKNKKTTYLIKRAKYRYTLENESFSNVIVPWFRFWSLKQALRSLSTKFRDFLIFAALTSSKIESEMEKIPQEYW